MLNIDAKNDKVKSYIHRLVQRWVMPKNLPLNNRTRRMNERNNECSYALHAATANVARARELLLLKPLPQCTKDERKERAKIQKHEWTKKQNREQQPFGCLPSSYIGEPVYINC
jgi:hypothetical protein